MLNEKNQQIIQMQAKIDSQSRGTKQKTLSY
jgi:hypothetical protein